MDIVFDRISEGHVIKNLTLVDDATHEAIAIVPESTMGGLYLIQVLKQLVTTRGIPRTIRSDNGKEFTSV